MTKETITSVDLMEPHLLRLSPPPSASSTASPRSPPPASPFSAASPIMTPSSACDTTSRLAPEAQDASPPIDAITTSLVDVESNTLPDNSSTYHYHHHHHHHHHHPHHRHQHHLPQRLSPQNWSSSPVMLESGNTAGEGVVVVVNHSLPLSPSMTPPILLSPATVSESGDDEDNENEEVSPRHTTSSDSVANSPLSLASEDEEEEEEEDVRVEGSTEDVPQDRTEESTTSNSPSPVHSPQKTTTTTTPEKSPSPRLARSSRPGSLRHARSSARFKPYRSGGTTARCTTAASTNSTTVLRPLNDGGLCQRSTITTSSSCDTSARTDNVNGADDDEVASLGSTTAHSDTTSDSSSSTSTSGHQQQQQHHQHPTLHRQLTIDTALANSQSAAAQQQSRAAKLALVQKLITVIDEDDFERFRAILRQSKQPDLNVFVNGQTALHYALLRGRDVSWCKQLVLFGANPNLSNLDGWHPLHLASFGGLNENLNYLISCNTNNGQQVK